MVGAGVNNFNSANVKEMMLIDFFELDHVNLSELIVQYDLFHDFVETLREYSVNKDGNNNELDYMKELRDLGFNTQFNDYFQEQFNDFFRYQEFALDRVSSKIYDEIARDYLNGSNSRLKDLTIVNGKKMYEINNMDPTTFIITDLQYEICETLKKNI